MGKSKPQKLSVRKIAQMFCLVLLAIFAGYAAIWLIKPKNPDNPFFTTANFRFEDYLNRKDMMEVIRHMFPEGTSKKEVEKTLVKNAGASIEPLEHKGPRIYRYLYEIPYLYDATWNIVVKYYENDTVDQIWVNGSAIHRYKPFTPGKLQ